MNHADSPCAGPGMALQDGITMSEMDFLLENSIGGSVMAFRVSIYRGNCTGGVNRSPETRETGCQLHTRPGSLQTARLSPGGSPVTLSLAVIECLQRWSLPTPAGPPRLICLYHLRKSIGHYQGPPFLWRGTGKWD